MKPAPKTRRHYDWTRWFGPGPGHTFVLKRGREYDCSSWVMGAMARNAAGRDQHRLELHLEVEDDQVTITIEGHLPPRRPTA